MGARGGGGGRGGRGGGGGSLAAGRSVDSVLGKSITLTPRNSKMGNATMTVTKNSKGEYVFNTVSTKGSSSGSTVTQPNAQKAQSWYNMQLSMYAKARV